MAPILAEPAGLPGSAQPPPSSLPGTGRSLAAMDDDLRRTLFDPADAHLLVLSRRPVPCPAATCVVSDVVWGEVVGLLRWPAAGTGRAAELENGRWGRLGGGGA